MENRLAMLVVRKMPAVCLLAFVSAFIATGTARADDAGETGVHGYTPKGCVWTTEPAVLGDIERFRDMKLGLMMHFGIYNQVGLIESWPLNDQAQTWSRPVCDMGVGKMRKPEPLARVIGELGAEQGDCVMVGDTANDFEAAEKCGIEAVAVARGYGTSAERQMADRLVRKAEEL